MDIPKRIHAAIIAFLVASLCGCAVSKAEPPDVPAPGKAGPEAQATQEDRFEVLLQKGESLNQRKEFEAAKPIWLRLLESEYFRTAREKWDPRCNRVLRGTGRCLGGWLEPDGDTFIEIPGTGDYAPDPTKQSTGKINLNSAQSIWSYLLKVIEDEGRKYTPEWWEAKFYSIYMRFKASEKYPIYLEYAFKLIRGQRRFQPEMGGLESKARFDYLDAAIKMKMEEESIPRS